MTFNFLDPLELDNSACEAVFFLLFADGNKTEKGHMLINVDKGYALDMKFQNFISFALFCEKYPPFLLTYHIPTSLSVNCERTFSFP